MYQPKTGKPCTCRPGLERDNCPHCEGTGDMIDFAAIRARTLEPNHQRLAVDLCAARLQAAAHTMADLWDAARILEGITGTEADGLTELVNTFAVDTFPPENLPGLDDCAESIRTLFGVLEDE